MWKKKDVGSRWGKGLCSQAGYKQRVRRTLLFPWHQTSATGVSLAKLSLSVCLFFRLTVCGALDRTPADR